jgi:hypothetical protein
MLRDGDVLSSLPQEDRDGYLDALEAYRAGHDGRRANEVPS